jgi:hypothetical protein
MVLWVAAAWCPPAATQRTLQSPPPLQNRDNRTEELLDFFFGSNCQLPLHVVVVVHSPCGEAFLVPHLCHEVNTIVQEVHSENCLLHIVVYHGILNVTDSLAIDCTADTYSHTLPRNFFMW